MPEITADELRQVAKDLEEMAREGLGAASEVSAPPSRGDLQNFPRPSAEDQAAKVGFTLLKESSDHAVAMLYALAKAMEKPSAGARGGGPQVPEAWMVPVQPYIAAFRARSAEQKKPSP